MRAGDANRAVATGSELASPILLARNFEAEHEHKLQALEARPEIAFEKDFLRWMLSDGAGAVLLERAPRGPLSLRIDWIDLSSAAHELPACMYAGADKNPDDVAARLAERRRRRLAARSRSSPSSRTCACSTRTSCAPRSANRCAAMVAKRGLTRRRHRLVPAAPVVARTSCSRCWTAWPRWACPSRASAGSRNLTTKGNTGSASPYIMLDELFRSGRIQQGQKLLMFVPESGRFSSGFVYMEAVG